jgi:hypothetical protein
MKISRAILPALVLASLPSHFRLPAAAQSASPDPSPLKAALIGKWVLDHEATADTWARLSFGSRQQVTPVPTKPGQPRIFRTNFINNPFNPQEYEQRKVVVLEGFRTNSNWNSLLLTFAPDGTGTTMPGQQKPGAPAAGTPFQWVLDGHKLTIKNPTNGYSLQIAFTNKNELRVPRGSTIMHGVTIVYKPERATPK